MGQKTCRACGKVTDSKYSKCSGCGSQLPSTPWGVLFFLFLLVIGGLYLFSKFGH